MVHCSEEGKITSVSGDNTGLLINVMDLDVICFCLHMEVEGRIIKSQRNFYKFYNFPWSYIRTGGMKPLATEA